MAHWLYPTNPNSDFWIRDPLTSEEVEVTPEGVDRLATYMDGPDRWILSKGFRSMRPGEDLLWVYFTAPLHEVTAVASIQGVSWDEDEQRWFADLLWRPEWCHELLANPIPTASLETYVQSPRRASEVGAEVLDRWIRGHGTYSPSPSPFDEPISAEDAREKTLAVISLRRGQARFRESLLDAFEGACAVTGCTDEAVLEAAHIQPYTGDQTNVPGNGLLLRSDIHTLFDLHLLAIDASSKVVVSESLRDPAYRKLSGRVLRMPSDRRWKPRKKLLAAHGKSLR